MQEISLELTVLSLLLPVPYCCTWDRRILAFWHLLEDSFICCLSWHPTYSHRTLLFAPAIEEAWCAHVWLLRALPHNEAVPCVHLARDLCLVWKFVRCVLSVAVSGHDQQHPAILDLSHTAQTVPVVRIFFLVILVFMGSLNFNSYEVFLGPSLWCRGRDVHNKLAKIHYLR